MCRTQCVLALLALCLGLAHSFDWDVVVAEDQKLYFLNDGDITFSDFPLPTYYYISWLTYDPVHNRVLFCTYQNKDLFVISFDLETEIPHTFIKKYPDSSLKGYAYDPVTELLFASDGHILYSFSLKPGDNNVVNGTVAINLEKDKTYFYDVAVDSCGKYVYWISNRYTIERARFDGTDREVIIDRNANNVYRQCLTIDKQKIYWVGNLENNDYEYTVESSDLNGNNRITLYSEKDNLVPNTLTISKDFIYWANTNDRFFWKLPKNPPHGTDVKPKRVSMKHNRPIQEMAAYYEIEDLNQTIQDCGALKSHIDSVKISTDASLLCVHGTKVSGKGLCKCTQGYIGERCDVSVCQNYCVRGDCSVSAEGQPICRCNAGYSGDRCEVNACHNYCLNNGVCSLNETSEPVCQCSGEFKGERCDLSVFLIKCVQTVSSLKEILKAGIPTGSM